MNSSFELLKEWELTIPDVFKKYSLGDNTDSIVDVKQLKPVFSFDYISLRNTQFCFNGKTLGRSDYKKLITALKDISKYTYEELSNNKKFHFHDIKWEDVTISSSDFHKCVYGNLYKGEDDITPYQIKVFDKSRIIGFLYKSVFYLVMFDIGHNAYPRKDNKKRK